MAVCRNWVFDLDDVRQEIPSETEITDQTIQDVLYTAVDQGYLKEKESQSHTWSADTSLRRKFLTE